MANRFSNCYPSKEDWREDYYYCLLLLFVPFRNGGDLLGVHSSTELAFNHYISSSSSMGGHHEKLSKILKAQSKIHEINDHRAVTEEICSKKGDSDESEGGGTGKSFLIDTIWLQVAEIWKDEASCDTKCAVGALTGIASYNIGDVTVYRLFSLPNEHEGKTAGYWALSKPAQKVMCTNLKLVIIDEVSMLSHLNLAYIHLR